MKNITDLEEERMMKFQSIKEIVMRFMKKMKKDRVSAAAAESAFFVIMGFVPFFYASSDVASVYGAVS